MNKKTLTIIGIIIVAITGGLLLYTAFQPKKISDEPGEVAELKLKGDFERKWAVNENGWQITGLVTDGNRVYYSGRVITAVDGGTGDKIWESQASSIVPLTLANNTIFCVTRESGLVALDASSGAEKWRLATGESAAATFAIGNTVYTANRQGTLFAVDASSGRQLWSTTLKSDKQFFITNIAADADTVAVISAPTASNSRLLTALDAKTGDIKWSRPSGLNVALLAGNGVMYTTREPVSATGATATKLLVLDSGNGNIRWELGMEGWVSPVLKIIDGTLYTGGVGPSGAAMLRGLDPQTGGEKWSCKIDDFKGDPTNAPVVIAVKDGLVYFSAGSEIYAADTQSGELKWRVKAGGLLMTEPVIADSSICFVYGSAGTLYALPLPQN